MRHVVLERWSRGQSYLHQRDPRYKTIGLILFLITLALIYPLNWPVVLGYSFLLLAGTFAAGLPPADVAWRAAAVLPFTATFALMSWWLGDNARAFSLLSKSYFSAYGALLLVGSTPMPALLNAFSALGVPFVLVLVGQFLYRYLFVITEQAQRMRDAAMCRGAALPTLSRKRRFSAAAASLAVLFGRSYERAEGIERAMVARGFSGKMPVAEGQGPSWRDSLFLGILIVVLALLSIAGKRG